MTAQLPSWPTTPPAHGCVVLREFADEDAHLAVELGDDPHIPLIGSLPAQPTAEQALAWIRRQRSQLTERERFSFAIANAESNKAVGAIGLGLRDLSAGRATAGYAVSPLHRGRGIATSALQALTRFAWTIPALYRVELYISSPGTPAPPTSRKRPDTGERACSAATRRSAAPGVTCCCMRQRTLTAALS
jgi:ribosomal-protein-alanine N-acetyltransferase